MSFVLKDEKQAEAVLLALKHEEDFKKRSISNVSQKGKEIIISVESDDVVALRASLNAYLRDIQIVQGIEKDNDLSAGQKTCLSCGQNASECKKHFEDADKVLDEVSSK